MNKTDRRAELLKNIQAYRTHKIYLTDKDLADFALPYAERAAIAEAKLDEANRENSRLLTMYNVTAIDEASANAKLAAAQQRVKELENERDNVRNHFNP